MVMDRLEAIDKEVGASTSPPSFGPLVHLSVHALDHSSVHSSVPCVGPFVASIRRVHSSRPFVASIRPFTPTCSAALTRRLFPRRLSPPTSDRIHHHIYIVYWYTTNVLTVIRHVHIYLSYASLKNRAND